MTMKPRRAQIRNEDDLRRVIAELSDDHTPRLIQDEDGVVVAVLMDPDHFTKLTNTPKSQMKRDRLLKYAGIWSDIDADALIADIYRWRDEAPPSPDPAAYFDVYPDRDER
jgi:hypothetical protein